MNDRKEAQAASLLPARSRSGNPAAALQRRSDPSEGVTCRLGDASCAGAHASTLRRSTGGAPRQGADSLIRLQREYGNRFVQRVMIVARRADILDEGGEVPAAVEQGIEPARGGGQSLDSAVRARMEPAFGADFRDVRVHTGPEADHLSQQISARAFTTGRDIFFRQGEYAPSGAAGGELLAHELTHVAQGGTGAVQGKLTVGAARSPAEDEADQVARQVMRQEPAQRAEEEEPAAVRRQSAGSSGVVRRLVGETKDIASLRGHLDGGDEDSAISLMGRLSQDEVTKILESREFKELAVSAFNNAEMARAASAMVPKGTAYRLLEWVFDEGTDWPSLRAMLPKVVNGREHVRADRWMRDQFVSLCNNEEMAEAVRLLGGTLVEQLDWMIVEGTSDKLVDQAIRLAPQGDLDPVKRNEKVQTGLREELSADGFRTAQQLLDGNLFAGEIKEKHTASHYERASPTAPWKMKEYGWDGAYEIRYNRTELRITVRIELTGVPVPPGQQALWLSEIGRRWNGKYHLENDRGRLPVVFEPVFTSVNPHHKVTVHAAGAACTRNDQTNWCVGKSDAVAHEFGHMLGLEDEYNLAKADYERLLLARAPAGLTPAAGYTIPGVMGTLAADADGRHMLAFLTWINAHRLPNESLYRLVSGA